MKGFVGLESWLGYSSFLFGVVAVGASGLVACGSDSPSGGGSAGANVGTAGMAATSGAGGSVTTGGSAGTAANAGSPSGGSAHAGTGGGSTSDKELAVSLYACKPECPAHQYCALIGPECTTEPCLAHAECRELPKCSASIACPVVPQETCLDDPSDSCNPAQGTACPGRCNCGEGPHPCGSEAALDRRPDICECVTPGTTKVCLNVQCPGDDVCDIVLGKAYCVSP